MPAGGIRIVDPAADTNFVLQDPPRPRIPARAKGHTAIPRFSRTSMDHNINALSPTLPELPNSPPPSRPTTSRYDSEAAQQPARSPTPPPSRQSLVSTRHTRIRSLSDPPLLPTTPVSLHSQSRLNYESLRKEPSPSPLPSPLHTLPIRPTALPSRLRPQQLRSLHRSSSLSASVYASRPPSSTRDPRASHEVMPDLEMLRMHERFSKLLPPSGGPFDAASTTVRTRLSSSTRRPSTSRPSTRASSSASFGYGFDAQSAYHLHLSHSGDARGIDDGSDYGFYYAFAWSEANENGRGNGKKLRRVRSRDGKLVRSERSRERSLARRESKEVRRVERSMSRGRRRERL
ncbi:MAG: hypothetical protein Q9227_003431 [Pyrenula ochraceoflavens]